MIFTKSITTPAATPITSPKRSIIPVTSGLVYAVEIEFPPGCSGLLHAQIFDSKYQFFPASPGEDIHSDAHLIRFDDLYIKQTAPFEFTVITWNLDETFEHEIQVRIALASQKVFIARYLPGIAFDKFSEIMQQTLREQQRLIKEQILLLNAKKDEGKNGKRPAGLANNNQSAKKYLRA